LSSNFNSDFRQIESGPNLNLITDHRWTNQSTVANLWENNIWIIQIEANVSVHNVFQSFQNISLRSRIYAITTGVQIQMFEVYKKTSAANLTVDLVCRINEKENKIEYLNKNEIWTRRRNLSGVHFRIGYVPNDNFFLKVNEVRQSDTLKNVLY
jgi:hypothetical protein